MKKNLLRFSISLSMFWFLSINIAISQNNYFEKMYDEQVANDQLGKALKAEPNKQVINLISYDVKSSSTKEIILKSDDILVLNLIGVPSSGFIWQIKGLNNNIAKLIVKDGEPAMGSGAKVKERFVLKSVNKGSTTFKLVYSRPWEKNNAPLNEITVNLNTQDSYSGSFEFQKEVPQQMNTKNFVSTNKTLPTNFDWRDSKGVTPPRDQGSSNACWAFGACGSFESVIKIKTGVERDLSEQWLGNCNNQNFTVSGGGWFPQYMFVDNGAVYESEEPFTQKNGTCDPSYSYHEKAIGWAYTDGITDTPWPKEKHNSSITQIKQAIYNYGAISANVYVGDAWNSYTGGILTSDNGKYGHMITLVGWNDDQQYWIIKNSWGTSWGENGYIYISYNVTSTNVGGYSVYIKYENGDTQKPSVPTGLSSSNITETSVNLSWNASSDNVGVTGYDIVQDGNIVKSVSETSSSITELTANTSYSFTVIAKDAAGNSSDESSAINITTLQNSGCTYCTSKGSNFSYEWITEIAIGSFTNSSNAAGYTNFSDKTINLSAGSSENITLTPKFSGSAYSEYWKIWIDLNNDCDFDDAGEELFSGNGLSAVSGSIKIPSTASGETTMRISMKYNGAPTTCETFTYGEVEDYKVVFSDAEPDTEAPTTPTGVVSSNITSSSVDLEWNASTDNVGVTEYQIFKDGVFETTANGTSATITGLVANTTYSFRVKAKDAAGNTSENSSSIDVTTLSNGGCTYCSSEGGISYEWIAKVSIGSFSNPSNAAKYSDFTDQTINLAAGASVNVTLTPGFSSSAYSEYWKIWIDFNNDCDFDDAGEELLSDNSKTAISGNIEIPPSANGTYRMRITMMYNEAPTACGSFTYGETEDYVVNISSSGAKILSLTETFGAKIYPNPVSNLFTVDINGAERATVQLININGQVILQKNISDSSGTIDVSQVSSGIYYVKILSLNRKSIIEKVIVE